MCMSQQHFDSKSTRITTFLKNTIKKQYKYIPCKNTYSDKYLNTIKYTE